MLREIWTDGASLGNPGPAGWAVLFDGELDTDFLPPATNNQTELFAVYMGLLKCSSGDTAIIFTDSKMVVGWLGKSWNCENHLTRGIIEACLIHKRALGLDLQFVRVKGHSGIYKNEVVDHAAHQSAKNGKRAKH